MSFLIKLSSIRRFLPSAVRPLCTNKIESDNEYNDSETIKNFEDAVNEAKEGIVETTLTIGEPRIKLPPVTTYLTCYHKTKEELELVPHTSRLTTHYDNPQNLVKIPYIKPFESTYACSRPVADPIERTVDIHKSILGLKPKSEFYLPGYYAFYDIVVIGGGAMGASAAYWLMQRGAANHLKILVVERDPTYSCANVTTSIGGLRQQFSLPENIQMGLFGADFLRTANKRLYCHEAYTPNVGFQPHGYLLLADEEGAEAMQEDYMTQIECGAKVEILTAKQIKRKFPWLHTDDIALGCYGYESEGWFDPWALLTAMKMKCKELGVHFIEGEVHNMAHEINTYKHFENTFEDEIEDEFMRINSQATRECHVHLPNGNVFPFHSSQFVICAGGESGHIANLAGIGCGAQIKTIPVPVDYRKRYIYNVYCPNGPGLNCPTVVDPSGAYFRRVGWSNNYLCGSSYSHDVDITNAEVDFEFFDEKIWPVLGHRAPCFQNLEMKSAWSNFYAYNTWDQSPIVGSHPQVRNVHFAIGGSGHSVQHAPALGRAVMEGMFDHQFTTLDLSRFLVDRIINGEKIIDRRNTLIDGS